MIPVRFTVCVHFCRITCYSLTYPSRDSFRVPLLFIPCISQDYIFTFSLPRQLRIYGNLQTRYLPFLFYPTDLHRRFCSVYSLLHMFIVILFSGRVFGLPPYPPCSLVFIYSSILSLFIDDAFLKKLIN